MLEGIPTELIAFLAWLASSAGVGAVMSEFFESETWFQKLSAKVKNRVVFGVSVLLGVIVMIVTKLPPDVIETIAPIATIIVTAIVSYLTSQRYHDDNHGEAETVSTSLNLNLSTKTPATVNTSVSPDTGQPGHDPIDPNG